MLFRKIEKKLRFENGDKTGSANSTDLPFQQSTCRLALEATIVSQSSAQSMAFAPVSWRNILSRDATHGGIRWELKNQ